MAAQEDKAKHRAHRGATEHTGCCRLIRDHATVSRIDMKPLCSLWLPLCSLCCALSLAGCMVGPNYSKPDAEVPAQFKEAGDWIPAQPSDSLPKGKWWEAFQDP